MIALLVLLAASAVLAAPSTSTDQDISSYAEQWRAVTDGCGQSKSCFLYPEECIATKDCVIGVSIEVIGPTYTFEMQSVGGVYVAVGLSEDQDMGATSVVECVNDDAAEAGKVSMYASYNKGDVNDRETPPFDGLTLIDGRYTEGSNITWCKFTRAETTTYQTVVYNMADTQYYLLLVAGSKATADSIGFHDVCKVSSGDKRFVADIGYYALP